MADRAGEGDLAMACAVRLGHVLAESGDLDALDRLAANLEQRAAAAPLPASASVAADLPGFTSHASCASSTPPRRRSSACAPPRWKRGSRRASRTTRSCSALLRLEQGTFEGLVGGLRSPRHLGAGPPGRGAAAARARRRRRGRASRPDLSAARRAAAVGELRPHGHDRLAHDARPRARRGSKTRRRRAGSTRSSHRMPASTRSSPVWPGCWRR